MFFGMLLDREYTALNILNGMLLGVTHLSSLVISPG